MSEPLRFRVLEAGAWISECVTRLPFRFGIVTMRAAPLCTVRVRIEHDGTISEGFASDLLVPKWFEKISEQSLEECWMRLTDGVARSCLAATDSSGGSAVEHAERIRWAREAGYVGPRSGRLLLHHGPALLERAMIDAVCRSARLGLRDAMRTGTLGCTDGAAVCDRRPLDRVHVRHTVGLVDPLDGADDAPSLDDGLPVTLEQAIRTYGLTHFKVKVSGDLDADLERLARIADVLAQASPGQSVCTLDGNEQYKSIAEIGTLLERMRSSGRLDQLLQRIAYLEQPLSRDLTFDQNASEGLQDLPLPVIIDEADADDEAFCDAIALGYRGVSMKNCKGVFRAMANAKRCRESGGRLFQSGEDLTNLPILALQQDLATAATLGLSHIERNGHHYFAGLAHLPESERQSALERHPDLYDPTDGGRLRIKGGMLDLASIHQAPGFGYAGPVDLASRIPIDEWSSARLASFTGG